MSSRQSDNSKATNDIESCKRTKLDHEKNVTEVNANLAKSSQDKIKHAADRTAIQIELGAIRQQITVLQRSYNKCEEKKTRLKKGLDAMDKKLDGGMPNGCAKAIRFLDDYCKRNKVRRPRQYALAQKVDGCTPLYTEVFALYTRGANLVLLCMHGDAGRSTDITARSSI